MKRLSAAIAAMCLIVVCGVATGQDKIAKQDAKAMRDLAQANIAEIETGKLAARKAQSAEVKKFGQQMADDHGKMLSELKQLASSKGVKLPEKAGAKERAEMQKLEALSADRFDRSYMSHMVKDHQNDVKETDKIARNAKDPDLKAAVEQANAKIKEHLQMAEQVAGTVGADGKA